MEAAACARAMLEFEGEEKSKGNEKSLASVMVAGIGRLSPHDLPLLQVPKCCGPWRVEQEQPTGLRRATTTSLSPALRTKGFWTSTP